MRSKKKDGWGIVDTKQSIEEEEEEG